MSELNGMDVAELNDYVESIRADRSMADRTPVVVAHWEGGSRSRVEMDGRKSLYLGGDDELSAMAALLGILAACDVEVVATHASLMGLELKDLRVEATGSFNVASLLGVESPTDAAYEEISYKVIVDAPDTTDDQIEYLKRNCEESSPVGDSLRKTIPLTLEFDTN